MKKGDFKPCINKKCSGKMKLMIDYSDVKHFDCVWCGGEQINIKYITLDIFNKETISWGYITNIKELRDGYSMLFDIR